MDSALDYPLEPLENGQDSSSANNPWTNAAYTLPPVFIISKSDDGTRPGPHLGTHVSNLLEESVDTRIAMAQNRSGDEQELFWSYGSSSEGPFAITGSVANDKNEAVPDYVPIAADLTISMHLTGLDIGVRRYTYANRAAVISRVFASLKDDEPLLGMAFCWRLENSGGNTYTAENFVDLHAKGKDYKNCRGVKTVSINFTKAPQGTEHNQYVRPFGYTATWTVLFVLDGRSGGAKSPAHITTPTHALFALFALCGPSRHVGPSSTRAVV